jgi:hypothetical protein
VRSAQGASAAEWATLSVMRAGIGGHVWRAKGMGTECRVVRQVQSWRGEEVVAWQSEQGQDRVQGLCPGVQSAGGVLRRQ